MAKKDYFLTIDTETTLSDKVADFAATISDRKGSIVNQCAVLVNGVFGIDALFYIRDEKASSLWSKQGKDRRFDAYNQMLSEGTRVLATVAAINRWLERAKGTYDPILTAYNLPFDVDKCQKTGIDLTLFEKRFCLWRASAEKWGQSKTFRKFILNKHGFNAPTAKGNMSYKTNAEVMAGFILGNTNLSEEPHTALEDIIGYELPILNQLIRTTKKSIYMNPSIGYSWQKYQVRDHYEPK